MQFTWPIRIYYEDTDAGGVVYYANYLKFMERARTEWLRAIGFDQSRMLDQLGLGFVVTEARARYRRPARLDDELMVGVAVESARGARIQFRQDIHRVDGELLCRGRVDIACLDLNTFRPQPVPDEICAEITQ